MVHMSRSDILPTTSFSHKISNPTYYGKEHFFENPFYIYEQIHNATFFDSTKSFWKFIFCAELLKWTMKC